MLSKWDMKSLLMLTSGNLLGFLRFSSRLLWLPSVVLYPTNLCNYRCSMCVHGMGRGDLRPDIMSPDLLRKILDDCSKLWPKPRVHFSGHGEPLVYPHIEEAMRLCRKHGLAFSMTTNGHLLKRYAEALVANGCRALNISIHGGETLQAQVSGVENALATQLEGIQALDLAKRKQGATTPRLALNCVISRTNLDSLGEFLRANETLPVDSITFQHLIFTREELVNGAEFLPSTDGEISILRDFMKQAATRAAKVRVHFFPRLKAESIAPYYREPDHAFGESCLLPWLTAQVFPDGSVGLCSLRFGNIADQSLMSIMNGKAMRAFRRAVSKGVFRSSECFRCCHRHFD